MSRRSWRALGASLAGTAIAWLLVACSVPAEDRARVLQPSDVPFDLVEPKQVSTTNAGTTAVAPTSAAIFLVRGDRLTEVARDPVDTAEALLEALLAGPTTAESETGVRTAIPSVEAVRSVDVSGDTATVDLAAQFADTPASDQRLSLAQLTFTLTSRPEIRRVVFTLDGEGANVPRGDGTTVDGPVGRADYASLAP
jgi:spore germination protein GerM